MEYLAVISPTDGQNPLNVHRQAVLVRGPGSTRKQTGHLPPVYTQCILFYLSRSRVTGSPAAGTGANNFVQLKLYDGQEFHDHFSVSIEAPDPAGT